MPEPQRLDIDYEIHWCSPWHVGSGQESPGVDRLLRRRFNAKGVQVPYVPGSQMKGVLRHRCEQLAAALGLPVVSPHVVGSDPNPAVLDAFRPLQTSGQFVDRLFGSRYHGGCLFVEDAMPKSNTPSVTRVNNRTSIDRLTGTAKAQTLFSTEVVTPTELSLVGRLSARHDPGLLTQEDDGFPYEYSLLVAALLTIDGLGGDKSAGLGRCRITIVNEAVRWNDETQYPVQNCLTNLEEEEFLEMINLVREGNGDA